MRMKNQLGLIYFLTVLLLVFGFYPYQLKSQSFKKKRYTAYGFAAGASNYVGDLDANFRTIQETDYHVGATINFRYGPQVTLRGQASYTNVHGKDANSRDEARFYRNLSFKSYVVELSGHIIIDFFENSGVWTKRVKYTPYMFGGIGVFKFNPKAQLDGTWYDLQPLGTEGQGLGSMGYDNYAKDKYSLIQICLPFGIGYRYQLNRNIDLALEMGWRKTFTDYLDDVSTVYAHPNDISTGKGELVVQLAERSYEFNDPNISNGYLPDNQRGDPTDDDWYIFTGFHITYIYRAGGVKCPKFR